MLLLAFETLLTQKKLATSDIGQSHQSGHRKASRSFGHPLATPEDVLILSTGLTRVKRATMLPNLD